MTPKRVFRTKNDIQINTFQSNMGLNLYSTDEWKTEGTVNSEHSSSIQRLHGALFALGDSDAAQCDAWRPYLHWRVIDNIAAVSSLLEHILAFDDTGNTPYYLFGCLLDDFVRFFIRLHAFPQYFFICQIVSYSICDQNMDSL
jgi:hypothetical protein